MSEAFAYSHETDSGPVWLTIGVDQRWHPTWDGEDLGAFGSPQEAVAALCSGTSLQPSCGTSLGAGVARQLSQWRAHPSPNVWMNQR